MFRKLKSKTKQHSNKKQRIFANTDKDAYKKAGVDKNLSSKERSREYHRVKRINENKKLTNGDSTSELSAFSNKKSYQKKRLVLFSNKFNIRKKKKLLKKRLNSINTFFKESIEITKDVSALCSKVLLSNNPYTLMDRISGDTYKLRPKICYRSC